MAIHHVQDYNIASAGETHLLMWQTWLGTFECAHPIKVNDQNFIRIKYILGMRKTP